MIRFLSLFAIFMGGGLLCAALLYAMALGSTPASDRVFGTGFLLVLIGSLPRLLVPDPAPTTRSSSGFPL